MGRRTAGETACVFSDLAFGRPRASCLGRPQSGPSIQYMKLHTLTRWKDFPGVGQGGKRIPVKPPVLPGHTRTAVSFQHLDDKLAGDAIDTANARKGGMTRVEPNPQRVKCCRCVDSPCPHVVPEQVKKIEVSPSALKHWIMSGGSEELPHPVFNRQAFVESEYEDNLKLPTGVTQGVLCPRCMYVTCKCGPNRKPRE